MHRLVTVVGLSGLLALASCSPATAAGPWKAQIVDAETKEPLEGVVVVAVWWKGTASVGGWSEEYHDSVEVATDRDGRFTIPARSFFSVNPFVRYKGPEFLFFRPGYGREVWPGYATLPAEKMKRLDTYEKLLQRDGIVLELPRLRTLKERRESVGRVTVGFDTVPHERTPLLDKAIADERRAVGYGG